MAKFLIIVSILISSLIIIADAQTVPRKREKIAEFRVYVHDVLGGPNPTVHEVARANITSTSPFSFGQVLVADDLMTAGPAANSQKLGRSQGLAVNTGLEEPAVIINGVFIFRGGKYNGSTLSIMGWKLIVGINQEIPIVGGTGVFVWREGMPFPTFTPAIPSPTLFCFHLICMLFTWIKNHLDFN